MTISENYDITDAGQKRWLFWARLRVAALVLAVLVVLWATICAARAQVDNPTVYPPTIIISGLVPPPTGGFYNSPSLTINIPGGTTWGASPTYPNGVSFTYPADSYTYQPSAQTWVGLCLNHTWYHGATKPSGLCNPIYLVNTASYYINWIQGQMPELAHAYPTPEVGQIPIACTQGHVLSFLDQSSCRTGNWDTITSHDPTTFANEGLPGGNAWEVNPQQGGVRFIVGQAPVPNSYIYQGCFGDSNGTESLNGINVQYTSCIARVVDPNPATRAGRLDLSTVDPSNNGGTGTIPRIACIRGCFTAGPNGDVPGGDKGPNTLNISQLYINGVNVTGALARLAGPQAEAAIRAAQAEYDARPRVQWPVPKFPGS